MTAFLNNLLQRHQAAASASFSSASSGSSIASNFVQPRLAARFENSARAGVQSSAEPQHDYFTGEQGGEQSIQKAGQLSLTPFPASPPSSSVETNQTSQLENSAKQASSLAINVEPQLGSAVDSLLGVNLSGSHSDAARGQNSNLNLSAAVGYATHDQSANVAVDARSTAQHISAQPASESYQPFGLLAERLRAANPETGQAGAAQTVAPVVPSGARAGTRQGEQQRAQTELQKELQDELQEKINEQALQQGVNHSAVQAPDWLADIQAELQRRGSSQHKTADAEPVINVSIGRVEIKAHPTNTPATSTARPQPKGAMTLDEYLTQRNSSKNTGGTAT